MSKRLLVIARQYEERMGDIESSIQEIKNLGAVQGPPGEQGSPGEPGHTPVKGVDYFTEQDIQSLNLASKDHNHDSTYIKRTGDFASSVDIDSLF